MPEAKRIREIINIFRWYMHPSKNGAANYRLDSPSEWNIVFSTQNTTFGMLPSVIQHLDVDYGGGLEVPRFFAPDSAGSSIEQFPVKITISMRFREVVIITRETMASIIVVTYNTAGKPVYTITPSTVIM
jgi:hypothetical protein